MRMPEYISRRFDELRDSLYSLRGYVPGKREIASGIAGLTLLAMSACTSAEPVQTPVEPPVQPPAQEQTYNLKGTVYHDYNGDGIREENEPGIPGVEIDWYTEPTSIKSIETDSNGIYNIQLDKGGTYTLSVDKNNVPGPNDQPYRYINISKAEFREITDSLKIDVNDDMNYDVALMQGFLTLPFGPDTKFLGNNQFGIEYYVDDDVRVGYIRNWKGETGHTYDNHSGTDFFMGENTPILAAAPGVVIDFPQPLNTEGITAYIQHESPYYNFYNFYSIITAYGHLNKVKVKVGDKVQRGDVIGLSGRVSRYVGSITIHNGKHLHFSVGLLTEPPPYKSATDIYGIYTDPYRPNSTGQDFREIKGIEKDFQTIINGHWTKDNDPQCP